MRKLIHSSFELDLSIFNISDTEENNWFSDTFFTKYSFPFDIDLTDDLDVAFDFISLYNTNPQTYFNLKYVHGNDIEEAIFEIESHQDKLSCTLRFGFEQLPSFDKKLSQLSLDKFDLPEGTDIYTHAQNVISKTWPEVNYNFPQIHTDKYSQDDVEWEFFEKKINNRVSNQFLVNEYNEIEGINYNRNIIQPLPYLLHILQRGMIDAGYTLSGKIITDEVFKKACVFANVDYYKVLRPSEDYFFSKSDRDYGDEYFTYNKTIEISGIGFFRIFGYFYTYSPFNCTIKLNGIELNDVFTGTSNPYSFNVNKVIQTNKEVNTLEFTLYGKIFHNTNPFNFISININRMYYENTLTPIIIYNQNEIDLTKSVPDITFGDFIKVVKNWFNYDLSIVDKIAIMNPVEDEIKYSNALDLQFTQVKNPLRKFTQGTSFLLKFQDVDSSNYKYDPIFHNRESVVSSGYVTDEKTTTIEVNALPLPLLVRDGVQTAYAFLDDASKVCLVAYNGIYNANNLAQPINDYLIPSVHEQYWRKWFNFRITSVGFNCSFLVFQEKIAELKAKRKVFAYNKYHIIKSINRSEVKPNLFQIELETQSLE